MRLPLAGLSLAVLAASACDVPTALPNYDMQWNIPTQTDTIAVSTFLPTGVTVTPNGQAFTASTGSANTAVTRQLGQDCNACALGNGTTIPKPAFTGGGNASVSLPSGVTTAVLVGDTLVVSITNNFNFDPLKPSAAVGSATGYLVIAVASGATSIGRDSINGATLGLGKNGTVTQRKIPLAGTVTGASGITVTTTINSPLGDAVTINSAQTLVVSAATPSFNVSSATVNLTNQTINANQTTLDLSSVDSSLTKHIDGGSFILTINNPLAITGTLPSLKVTLGSGAAPVQKSFNLANGNNVSTLTFSKAELQSLIGQKVPFTMNGTASGASLTVTPNAVITITTRIQVAINPGNG